MPDKSAFTHLFNSGHNDALITLTGFDHAAFNELHSLFEPWFEGYAPYTKDGVIQKVPVRNKRLGRKRIVTPRICVLEEERMAQNALQ